MAKILLVEDSSRESSVYLQHLHERGHEVTLATNLADALGCLGEIEFEGILCDFSFPASADEIANIPTASTHATQISDTKNPNIWMTVWSMSFLEDCVTDVQRGLLEGGKINSVRAKGAGNIGGVIDEMEEGIAARQRGADKIKILLADDDSAKLRDVKRDLEGLGFEVETAECYQEAASMGIAEFYPIIITDTVMPMMKTSSKPYNFNQFAGFDLASEIRRNQRTPEQQSKIIVWTDEVTDRFLAEMEDCVADRMLGSKNIYEIREQLLEWKTEIEAVSERGGGAEGKFVEMIHGGRREIGALSL
ncbi:MAG: hypothetical protein COV36_07960 [Alphaproteobacteria bacterium CG11_big_fil_rev_8_21_14_0_20_44_7]|nr:MAG: hypothetical protein COV36_07960 [Alphaproteobacteria bacterium CG11_big_fil_rev_8_21_14_0_20_44_7]